MAADDVGDREAAIGDELTRLRTRAGLTQQELADRSGVSRSYIANIEAGGRSLLGGPALFDLSDVLGVPVEHWRPYLASQPPEPPPSRGKHK